MKKQEKSLLMLGGIVIGLIIIVLVAYGMWYANRTIAVDISDEERTSLTEQLEQQQEEMRSFGKEGETNKANAARLEAARAAQLLGKIGLAERYYKKIIDINPEFNRAVYNYATLLEELGRIREAELLYGQLVNQAYNEQYLRKYVDAVRAQNEDGTRNKQLEAILLAGIDAGFGQTPYLMQQLAWLYKDMGDCQLAEDHYKVLLSITEEVAKEGVRRDMESLKETCGQE